MRNSWRTWAGAAALLLTGTAWSQEPLRGHTVDASVTPKVVLPSAVRPAPLAPAVVTAAETKPPIRPLPRLKPVAQTEVVPAVATQSAAPGLVRASAQVAAATTSGPSRFVPAVPSEVPSPSVPLTRLKEPAAEPMRSFLRVQYRPSSDPLPPAPPAVVTEAPVQTAPLADPAPLADTGCGCCSAGHGGVAGKMIGLKAKLAPLLAWFTYCPRSCCGHPFRPAPYIPPLYAYFFDHCRPCVGLPAPLPPPVEHVPVH